MSGKKLPAIMFYPADWLTDEVARCSLGAQGLWLRMMFVAHGSKRYGYLCENGLPIPPGSIAIACGSTLEQYNTLLAELDRAGVPSRTPTGIIYSRRMVRDAKTRQLRQKAGKLGGNPHLMKSGLVKQVDNHPLIQKPVNETGKKKQTAETEKLFSFPDELCRADFYEAWKRWLQHRSEIRKPLKPTGQNILIKKLAGIGADRAIAAIDFSISNGYQGCFEPQASKGKAQQAGAVGLSVAETMDLVRARQVLKDNE